MTTQTLLQRWLPLTLSPTENSESSQSRPATQRDVRRQYERPTSFTDLLPWMEYDPEHKTFLLDDGISCGAMFELSPVGTEARTQDFMTELRDSLQTVLTDALPETDDAPWILQCYVNDEPSLRVFEEQLQAYPDRDTRETMFTQSFHGLFSDHLQRVCQDGGLFVDSAVTGSRWRGQMRRIRAVIYRRLPTNYKPVRGGLKPELMLNEVATKFTSLLQSCGVRVRRCEGKDFYEWLLRWFNPASAITKGDSNTLLC